MKQLLILMSAVFVFHSGVVACGTIDLRYENYLKAEDDNSRLNELRFLICNPIVSSYKKDETSTQKLMSLVENALIRSEQLKKKTDVLGADWTSGYYRNLAYRIYLRFKLFDQSIKRNSEILDLFGKSMSTNAKQVYNSFKALSPTDWLSTDDGLSLAVMEYAVKLDSEVKMAIE